MLSKALILVILFLFLFGTIGVQAFHGKLHLFEPAWISFDHIGVAMFTIVNIMTLDNWQDILTALNEKANPIGSAVYMITVTFIGSFFLLNLTITVLKSSYVAEKKEELKNRRVNVLKSLKRRVLRAKKGGKNLRDLKAVASYNSALKPDDAEKKPDGMLERLSQHAKDITSDDGVFDKIILSAICLNTLVLGIETYYRKEENTVGG